MEVMAGSRIKENQHPSRFFYRGVVPVVHCYYRPTSIPLHSSALPAFAALQPPAGERRNAAAAGTGGDVCGIRTGDAHAS